MVCRRWERIGSALRWETSARTIPGDLGRNQGVRSRGAWAGQRDSPAAGRKPWAGEGPLAGNGGPKRRARKFLRAGLSTPAGAPGFVVALDKTETFATRRHATENCQSLHLVKPHNW